ncbi:MAG: hypothetical protein AAF797_12595 [Planctomycetota bacterium]
MALSIPPHNRTLPPDAKAPKAPKAHAADDDHLTSRISQLWQASSSTAPTTPAEPLARQGPDNGTLGIDDLPGASQLMPRLLRLLDEHPHRPTAAFRPIVRRMILDTSFCCDAGDPVGLRQTQSQADQLADRVVQLLDQIRIRQDHAARPELRLG